MSDNDQELQSKNPTDLLREQVVLLRQTQTALVHIQENQTKILESLGGLYAINRESGDEGMDVFVNDINMPFVSMVGFIIKWSIAAIPAGIILIVLGGLIWIVFGGLIAALLT